MSSASSASPPSRLVWADIGPEDDETPSSKKAFSSAESKEGAVRQVVENVTNEKGQKIRVTRKIRSVLRPVRINRKVVERKNWKKFGDCGEVPKGAVEQNVTYKSFESISLDIRPKKREEEKEESDVGKLVGGGSSSVIVCRNCGLTGHWTLKCPKRSQIALSTYPGDDAQEKQNDSANSSAPSPSSSDASTANAKYVPLHIKNAQEGKRGVSSLRDNEATLRVTNLSEDVSEADLADLFRRFGHTTRIYLAKDHSTGNNRGFAFISFTNRADAQTAIDKLNGHGYDNLILKVEWSKSREEKEGNEGGERERQTDGAEQERDRFERRNRY